MSIWRKAAWTAGGLVVVAGAAAAYLVATFDPNRYKTVLVDHVRTEYQRTLALNGPISLGVFPRLHVALRDVELSEHARPERFAVLRELDLAVQVLPLLKGRLEIDRIKAHGVVLRYQRDAQGRSNIDDLLQRPDKDKPEEPGGEPLRFEAAGVDLANVAADVDDAVTGVKGRVSIASLDSGRLADGVRSKVALQAQARLERPQAAALEVKGSLAVTPDLAQAGVLAEDVDLALQGRGAGFEQAQARLQAERLQWDGQRKAAVARALSIDGQARQTPAAGGAPLVIEQLHVALDEMAHDPSAQSLALTQLAASLKGTQGGNPVSAELAWPNLTVKGDALQGSPVQGRVALGGPVATEASFSSQAPAGGFEQVRLPGFAVDFKTTMALPAGQREITGQVRADLTVAPKARRGEVSGLSVAARVQEPSLPVLQLAAAGQAAATPGEARWSLQGKLNDNPFQTQGTAVLGKGRPSINAQARFTELDLNRLLPPPKAAAASPAPGASGGQPGGGAADAPVDLAGLDALDGHFDLSAGRLAWRQYRVADARVKAALSGGRLTLDTLSGQAWGGRFQASGGAQAGSPQRVHLKAAADGVNVLALLKDVAGKDILEGTGQVRLDVQAQGSKVSALTSSLDGTAALVLRDGAVRGINLAKSLREAKARLSGRSDAVQEARQTEKTDFTELSASFQIDDGIARNRDLSAKSPFLRLTGEGQVNLPAKRLDYTVNATVANTGKGQDGAELEALKGLTVPVRLTGPIEAPDWRIQWSGVAIGAMQDTLKGRLEDKLKERLLGKPAAPASGASAPAQPAGSAEDELKRKLRDKFKGLLK